MEATGAAMQEAQRELLRDEIAKHERLMGPEDGLGFGVSGADDEALQQRDALLRERGGISSLQPGDDTDPDGDRVILAEFRKLGLVPDGADGNSREHWGHTDEDLHPDGPTEYGLLTHEQYETANRRYLRYHERKIRRLREQIAGPPPSTPPPRGPRVSEPPGTMLRGQGASPSHLTGGGPWSLHSLAALEVDKQMQTLWRLERQLQEGFWGRDNWKKSQIRMYGQPIGDMPFDDLILDTIKQVGLPRKWGMLPHRVDIRGRVEADPWTESQVTQEQFETVDRRFKEAMDDYIRSTGLRDARDYLQGVDLHHAGYIVGVGQQRGWGLGHMREMLGSGARREQRLQHIAQSMEMHGSGAPNTRPSAQMLQVSAARLTRKAVTGPPHAGASAPTVIAGTGLIAPAPGWHYMATGELMKDPE